MDPNVEIFPVSAMKIKLIDGAKRNEFHRNSSPTLNVDNDSSKMSLCSKQETGRHGKLLNSKLLTSSAHSVHSVHSAAQETSSTPTIETQASPRLTNPQPRRSNAPPAQSDASAKSRQTAQPPKPNPWDAARSKAGSDKPQAWTPRAVRRGA